MIQIFILKSKHIFAIRLVQKLKNVENKKKKNDYEVILIAETSKGKTDAPYYQLDIK